MQLLHLISLKLSGGILIKTNNKKHPHFLNPQESILEESLSFVMEI